MSITKIENNYKAVVENKRGKRHIYEFMSAFIKLTPAVIKSSVPKYGMKYTTNRALQNLIRKRTLGYSCKASLRYCVINKTGSKIKDTWSKLSCVWSMLI